MNQDAPSSGRKKRAYKELPLDLLDVAPKDITSVVCAVELDKTTDKDVQMAQKIVRGDVVVDFASLNVDQLRLLCRRLGITGASSAKRDVCRQMIALCHNINANAAKRTDDPRSVEQQATNTLLRQVNVVFSSEFIYRFEQLNDGKTRVDHETGNLAKKFWSDATMAYNDFNDDDLEQGDSEAGGEVDIAQLTLQATFWEDIKKITLDLTSKEKIHQTIDDIIDLLDVAVNLPVTNTKKAVDSR